MRRTLLPRPTRATATAVTASRRGVLDGRRRRSPDVRRLVCGLALPRAWTGRGRRACRATAGCTSCCRPIDAPRLRAGVVQRLVDVVAHLLDRVPYPIRGGEPVVHDERLIAT